jgi:hypothetical protein
VASPAQVHAILAEVSVIRPELAAFFGCLYYAALRPEEAVALRDGDCALPPRGWGTLVLARACPRTGSAWTSTGSPHEPRGLKRRPDGAVRAVPIPRSWSPCSAGTFAATAPPGTGAAVPRRPRRHAQREPVRPHLAHRSCRRARPGSGRGPPRPSALRSAARGPALVADLHRFTCRGRRSCREQPSCPVRHLCPLHPRPPSDRQSADRARPGHRWPITVCHSKRFRGPLPSL